MSSDAPTIAQAREQSRELVPRHPVPVPGACPPPRLIITRTGPDAPLDVLPLWVEGPPGRSRSIRPIRVAILWVAAALGALALIAG